MCMVVGLDIVNFSFTEISTSIYCVEGYIPGIPIFSLPLFMQNSKEVRVKTGKVARFARIRQKFLKSVKF